MMDFNKLFVGDSWKLATQLEDESVDCVVTSPPYWGLRDYGTAMWSGGDISCQHKLEYNEDPKVKGRNTGIYHDICGLCGAKRIDEQAGLEEHPQQWVDKMVELCELLRPKLKKSGVMFWNCGETYFGGGGVTGRPEDWEDLEVGKLSAHPSEEYQKKKNNHKSNWLQPKQLLGLPWRFAIAMQEKGWILRNACIWDKPNHMPSSVKDRFSNGYEYVFLFAKNRKYWFNLDSVREPHQANSILRNEYGEREYGEPMSARNRALQAGEFLHTAGKNPGDVWRITTRPHPFAHFAVFPDELAERMIKSGCPEFVCKACGKPRTRITESTGTTMNIRVRDTNEGRIKNYQIKASQEELENYDKEIIGERKTVGWSDCGCNAGFQGGVCLDPFMGSGTVAVVAKRLGRQYIGFELSQKYIDIAQNRVRGVANWNIIKDIQQGIQKTINEAK